MERNDPQENETEKEGSGAFACILLALLIVLFCGCLLLTKLSFAFEMPWTAVFAPFWGSGLVLNAWYIGRILYTLQKKT